MNLVRTENGLQVHNGGKADDREIGPEHELAAALTRLAESNDNLAKAVKASGAFTEAIFWKLKPKDRAELMGVCQATERKLRRERALNKSFSGRRGRES